MSTELSQKMVLATKWSAFTEIAAKLVSPITSMILARLLTPEAYGVVATLNMIIVFAEIFTDAGFQKYLIQHEFINDDDLEKTSNVAFWSNFVMSFFVWGIIALFSTPLMRLVGNPGYERALIVTSSVIPLAAFSSIQMALYRRKLDYKTLFKIRIIGICVPFVITIPAAFILRNFWALLIGSISTQLINVIVLSIFSTWRPRLYYSWKRFKAMFSFTFWTMLETLSSWLVTYFDVFIIGSMLSQYYVGLYKTSSALVGQVMSLITATTTSVLFSSLSRLQNDEKEFQRIFFRFQKFVSIFVIPVGVGLFCYSDFFTLVVLGEQWRDASKIIGLWALVSGIMIVLNHYCVVIYRAKGKPKLSTLSQWLHIVVLWPAVLIAVNYGFECLYVTRTLMRLEHVLVDMIIMQFVVHISVRKLVLNVFPSMISAVVMFGTSLLVKTISDGFMWNIVGVLMSTISFFCSILFFPAERSLLKNAIKKLYKGGNN